MKGSNLTKLGFNILSLYFLSKKIRIYDTKSNHYKFNLFGSHECYFGRKRLTRRLSVSLRVDC